MELNESICPTSDSVSDSRQTEKTRYCDIVCQISFDRVWPHQIHISHLLSGHLSLLQRMQLAKRFHWRDHRE